MRTMVRVTGTALSAATTILLGACSGMTDTGSHSHNCSVLATGIGWAAMDFELNHTDSRSCPSTAETNTYQSAGGQVVDKWYGSGGSADCSDWVRLRIFDSSGILRGEDYESFSEFPYGTWQAQLSAGFTTGQGWDPGRDYPTFDVFGCGSDVWVDTEIDYWGGGH